MLQAKQNVNRKKWQNAIFSYSHTCTYTHKHRRTYSGVDEFLRCIHLQIKEHNCTEDHESPDCQLQQITQPRPQLGV